MSFYLFQYWYETKELWKMKGKAQEWLSWKLIYRGWKIDPSLDGKVILSNQTD